MSAFSCVGKLKGKGNAQRNQFNFFMRMKGSGHLSLHPMAPKRFYTMEMEQAIEEDAFIEDKGLEKGEVKLAPGIKNYLAIKEKYPDFLLLYQIGDFFEMFFEDAQRGSGLLDIVLTKKHDIPMCGIPVHSLDNYLERLVRKGVMVAICEQIEDAYGKRRNSPIKREVTRLVTPGTLTEDKFLETRKHNFLMAITKNGSDPTVLGLSWVDLSTGEFKTSPSKISLLSTDLARLSPNEILCPLNVTETKDINTILNGYYVTIWPQKDFCPIKGKQFLTKLFGVESSRNIKPVGDQNFTDEELSSCNAVLEYISYTQKGKMPKLSEPERFFAKTIMFIDAVTRRSLELTTTQFGEKKGSVLEELDCTVTPMGARLLSSRLTSPLTSSLEIQRRLDLVEYFYGHSVFREKLRSMMRACHDLERCLQRLTLGRGGPRDLAAIASTLTEMSHIKEEVIHYNELNPQKLPELLETILKKLEASASLKDLVSLLERALVDDPPANITFGDFITEGYCPQLDEQRKLKLHGQKYLEDLTVQYQTKYGLPFRLRHSPSSGYVVTLSPSNHKLVDTQHFKNSRSYKGAMAYKTIDILELEVKVDKAVFAVKQREEEIFAELCSETMKRYLQSCVLKQ
eukprot:TRINITY_DN11115_c0_g1_i2.p1 TRINITY_DN11115_c0_g1~~TRINITY_DN11115_c0_g1_i2.p1  ORF type:complete len:644 (-),score=163.40 TRINITY_DN11115_c0_g1_i2:3-1883(-)